MAAQPGRLQAAFTSGEVAPEIYSRTDLRQYYSSAARMLNFEPVPQGGFRLMPRTRDIGGVRGDLAPLTGTLTTSLGPHSAAATIATLTFDEPQAVAVVEITDFAANLSVAGALQVEYQDAADSMWRPMLAPFAVGTAARTRRVGARPQEPVAASAIRLRFAAATDAITFTLGDLLAWRETGEFHPLRARPFSFSSDQSYVMVFGHQHVDVWRQGVFVGCAKTAIPASRVHQVVEVQQLDLMLLFLDDFAPGRLFRAGGDHEWDSRPQPFERVPNVDYGDDYDRLSNIWQVVLQYPAGAAGGLSLVFSVLGENTPALTIPTGPDFAAYAADIKSALEALPSVQPGISVTTASAGTNSQSFTIDFIGEGNIGQAFSVLATVVNSPSAGASTVQIRRADPGNEPLFSDVRGYASAGIFEQERLATGGFKSKRGAILFSPAGDFFSGDIEIETGSGGILVQMSTRGSERIVRFAKSKHLCIFTTDAEYYVSDRRITRDQPVNIVESTRQGVAPDVPIVESEDGLLMVSKNRSVIFVHTYDDINQGYTTEPISLLASHLIRAINDAAIQRAEESNDAGRYILVRGDGTAVVGILIRSQEVTGFAQWSTPGGAVKSVMVDGANDVFMVIDRDLAGGVRPRLERWENDYLVDGAVVANVDGASLTGLQLLEGVEVWAQCQADGDEWIFGPFIVEDGAITLPREVDSAIVGRWAPPLARTLPPPRDVAENVVLKRPARVHSVSASLIGATSMAIAANGGRAQDIQFLRAGMDSDRPPPPYTGDKSLDGLLGYTMDGQVEITQRRPGRLQLSGLIVQVKI